MELFGYADPQDENPLVVSASLSPQPPEVLIGGRNEIQYEVAVRDGEPVHIRVEYGIYFVKAEGRHSENPFCYPIKPYLAARI